MYASGTLILDDTYRIERELGRGAFGIVYLATHQRLNVARAVKVVHAEELGMGSTLRTDFRNRFQLEAQLASRLTHPHVIQVYDFAEWQGALHCVMEYAPGGSLADLLKQEGQQSVTRVLALLDDCCAGLDALHEQLGVIHRDVKPANLLLDPQGRLKVADLGLAQVGGSSPSQRSLHGSNAPDHPGTPEYSSPEHRISSEPLSPTSDVFSLGCVAFELLTGKRWKAMQTKVEGPADLRPDTPRWLDAVVRRMLAPEPGLRKADAADPHKRYVSMAQVRAALVTAAGSPVKTVGDRDASKAGEATRAGGSQPQTRSTRAALVLSLAALLLAAVVIGLIWVRRADDGGSLPPTNVAAAASATPIGNSAVGVEPDTPMPTEEPAESMATPAPTPTSTSTSTPTITPTSTPTITPTHTPSHTSTATATSAPSATPTATPTLAPTPDVDATKASFEATVAAAISATSAAATAAAPTVTPTPTPTATDTLRPTYTPTRTPDVRATSDANQTQVAAAVAMTRAAQVAHTPTHTPTPSARALVMANMRVGPGLGYEISGHATVGQEVDIVGRTETGDWYLLENGSWISASVVEGASPEIVPIVATPTSEALVPASESANWVSVEAGTFWMGCDGSDPSCAVGEGPLREVYVSAFQIYRYEVTNSSYAACVIAGACLPPKTFSSETRGDYYNNTAYANHPVLAVTWHQAAAFCAWAGARLPTEAEWEKAARGSGDARLFPWGNSWPDCTLANFDPEGTSNRCVGDTSEAGAFPAGASPYGALDMAGNVWEWTADWYSANSYSVGDVDPSGPVSGESKVVRGGSFGRGEDRLRVARRSIDAPHVWSLDVGFRCAASE